MQIHCHHACTGHRRPCGCGCPDLVGGQPDRSVAYSFHLRAGRRRYALVSMLHRSSESTTRSTDVTDDSIKRPIYKPGTTRVPKNAIPCYDPATMQYLGTVPAMSAQEVRRRMNAELTRLGAAHPIHAGDRGRSTRQGRCAGVEIEHLWATQAPAAHPAQVHHRAPGGHMPGVGARLRCDAVHGTPSQCTSAACSCCDARAHIWRMVHMSSCAALL